MEINSGDNDMGVVIVIDPGHGGENEGGMYGEYVEKELTLVVAKAMQEHLEQFDDVTVYLTRTEDETLEIKDRLAFADSVHADFYVSLHFNMSVSHDLYGFEVWLPSRWELYKKAYPFSEIIHDDYTAGTYSLYSRGLKTRLGDHGDYYGVIRYGTQYGFPAVIVEHAHLDNENDSALLSAGDLTAALVRMGERDAEAIAKAFHLSSETLSEDYSDYPLPEAEAVGTIIAPDESPAEVCHISLVEADAEAESITVSIEAEDYGSYLIYYKVSIDGGQSYSELFPWPRSAWNRAMTQTEAVLPVPEGQELDVVAAVYNSFDRITESNHLTVPALHKKEVETQEEPQEKPQEEEALKADPEASSFSDIEYEAADFATYQEIDAIAETKEALSVSAFSDSNGFYIGIAAVLSVLFLCLLLAMRKFIFIGRTRRSSKAGGKQAFRQTISDSGKASKTMRADADEHTWSSTDEFDLDFADALTDYDWERNRK